MIGLEGQYIFRFQLGLESDFIDEENLLNFRLAEEAGGTLPSFELSFLSKKDDILSKLNESTDLGVTYGKSANELVDATLAIMSMDVSKSGSDHRIITLRGLYSAIKYNSQTNLFLSGNKSAVEVLKDIVTPHFKPDFNLESSDDSQIWVQPNQTDRAFVKELWLHSWLENSFVAIGISSDGKFIAKDVAASFLNPFQWKFTQELDANSDIDIPYDGDYALSVNRGFVNNWVGYDREQLTFKFEDGTQTLTKETTEPVLALTELFAKREDVEKRFASQSVLTQNTHENYWRAARKNLAYLAQFGDTKITLSFTGLFKEIRVLDLAMFKDSEIGQDGSGSAEAQSGLYIVTKVIRAYENRQFSTVVELSRESLNQVQGDLITDTTSGSLSVPAAEEDFQTSTDSENEALNG